jgi:hypothetical protein
MSDYRGDFEVHLTVQATDDAALERFRDWCRVVARSASIRRDGLRCVWRIARMA